MTIQNLANKNKAPINLLDCFSVATWKCNSPLQNVYIYMIYKISMKVMRFLFEIKLSSCNTVKTNHIQRHASATEWANPLTAITRTFLSLSLSRDK